SNFGGRDLMQSSALVRKALMAVGIGVIAFTWPASTPVRAAAVPPPQTALMLSCDTCSAQVSISGLRQIGPYASQAEAEAAANDGSALAELAQLIAQAMNVHCRSCPVDPHIHVCFPVV